MSKQNYTPEHLRTVAASMDPDLLEEALVASLEVQENWTHTDRPGNMDALRMAMVVAALDAVRNCAEDRRYAYGDYLPDGLDDLEDVQAWVCSYCEHLAAGGAGDEAGTSEADAFFQKHAAPEYCITLVGETRAGEDSEVTGVCYVCSSLDGLGQIKLSRMA